jgi:hypothetical protein
MLTTIKFSYHSMFLTLYDCGNHIFSISVRFTNSDTNNGAILLLLVDYHWKQLCAMSFVDETNIHSPIHILSSPPTMLNRTPTQHLFATLNYLEKLCAPKITTEETAALRSLQWTGFFDAIQEHLNHQLYNSMGIHVRKLCTEDRECEKFTLEVKQTMICSCLTETIGEYVTYCSAKVFTESATWRRAVNFFWP